MIHQRAVGRFEQRVRDVIARIALRPPIKAADGRFSKSYRANVIDPDDMEKFRILANDAFEVISQHYGKDYFSFKYEWGFVERDGEQVKALVPHGDYGKAIAMLGVLAFGNITLKPKKLPLSDDERALRATVVQKVGRRKPGEDPNPLAHDKRLNYRPDAPTDTKLDEYGPELWQILEDFLLIAQIPERAFVHQAKSRDGWWNMRALSNKLNGATGREAAKLGAQMIAARRARSR